MRVFFVFIEKLLKVLFFFFVNWVRKWCVSFRILVLWVCSGGRLMGRI